ncbi:hypothetical protein Bhyg_05581 [Pseudolycoriella hygida]|uniref:Uncharacterized protein n=1 Tax=Pseudolycoriella hygida TaxID=35572 RepID=A0A9Q0S246_9DIPT|nr:hypothetical protein Bhyg_05581 [Pseudolycoriella hygida]
MVLYYTLGVETQKKYDGINPWRDNKCINNSWLREVYLFVQYNWTTYMVEQQCGMICYAALISTDNSMVPPEFQTQLNFNKMKYSNNEMYAPAFSNRVQNGFGVTEDVEIVTEIEDIVEEKVSQQIEAETDQLANG